MESSSESLLVTLLHHWKGGGFWMYPIALCLVFAVAIIVDRVMMLFIRAKVNKEEFVSQMTKHVLAGDLHGAVKFVSSQPATPLTNVVKAGLLRVNANDQIVQSALDEASLREMPKIEKRTGYLAMIANLAMLLGLLGTISGLIACFAAVAKPGVDPALKSSLLADGIAEAMNCTAFGLIAAITALLGFAFLNGRTQHLVDDINETSVAILNLVVNNRDKLKA
jgi:biopolymer transport protein ExbB